MVTKIDGLVSGLDTTAIVNQLMELERRPIDRIQTRIDKAQAQKTAYQEMAAKFLAISTRATDLNRASIYDATTVKSLNEAVLRAEGQAVSTTGSFRYDVKRLSGSHQVVSGGFRDMDATPVGRGQLRIDTGPSELLRNVELRELNGGEGFSRGRMRITDRGGRTATVDLSGATTVRDVLDAINEATGLAVEADVEGGSFVIRSTSGETASNLRVEEVAGGTTAASLGLRGEEAADELVGDRVRTVGEKTLLSDLSDGRGVDQGSGADFTIQVGADSITIDLEGVQTLGDLRSLIHTAAQAGGVDLTVDYGPDGDRLVLTNGAGTENITVTDLHGAARSLGLTGQPAAPTLTGSALNAGLRDSLLAGLHGGSGVELGTIRLTDRLGNSADVDLTGAETVEEVLRRINENGAADVLARIDSTGTGLELVDQTGVTDPAMRLRVEDLDSTAARDLGLLSELTAAVDAGSGESLTSAGLVGFQPEFLLGRTLHVTSGAAAGQERRIVGYDASTGTLTLDGELTVAAGDGVEIRRGNAGAIDGNDLDRQWLSRGTRLAALRGGEGIPSGSFSVTNREGHTWTVNLPSGGNASLGDLLDAINKGGYGVNARVNDTGDGILLEDTTGGGGTLKVQDVGGGTTAKSLGLAGEALPTAPDRLEGSYEYVIDLDGTEVLRDVQILVNSLGAPVSASVFNDGTMQSPYRLNLVSRSGGRLSNFTAEFLGPKTEFGVSSRGRDAVVLLGDSSGTPTLITSRSNRIENILAGLTVTLTGVGATTVEVQREPGQVVEKVQALVDAVNEVLQQINELTRYDTEKNESAILFGDPALRQISSNLTRSFTGVMTGGGTVTLPSQIGIRTERDGTLKFDSSKLQALLTQDPDGVKNFFTARVPLQTTTPLSKFGNGDGLDINFDANLPEFRINLRDGSSVEVKLHGASVLDDVLRKINDAADNGGKVTARISADGTRLELVDNTGGGGSISVTSLHDSQAASRLGLVGSVSDSSVFQGRLRALAGSPGFGGRLEESLQFVSRPVTGIMYQKTLNLDRRIADYGSRVKDIEKRLISVEARLSRQFSQMEVLLNDSQSTMQRLQAQMATLPTSRR